MITLDLEPQEIDLIFVALQNSQTPAPFVVVKALLDKILEQGRPQLEALVVQTEEPEKAGGTD